MSLFTAGELRMFTDLVREASPDTVTISRPSSVSSGAGQTITWTDQASYACSVRPSPQQPDEAEFGGRLAGRVPWDITIPGVADVRRNDRLIVGTRTFDVLAVRAPESWQVRTVSVCVEIS